MKPNRSERQRQRILTVLETQRTVAEVATVLFMTLRPAQRYISVLRAEKLVYIAAWKRLTPTGEFTPFYACGARPDVPKPVAMSNAERCERVRAKRNADSGKRDLYLGKQRAKQWVTKKTPLHDWVAACLKPGVLEGEPA